MKTKTIIWRMVIEVLVVLMAFSAVDMMSSPSESTAAAVTDAVYKKLLEPICMVEVHSAIRSAEKIPRREIPEQCFFSKFFESPPARARSPRAFRQS